MHVRLFREHVGTLETVTFLAIAVTAFLVLITWAT